MKMIVDVVGMTHIERERKIFYIEADKDQIFINHFTIDISNIPWS